MEKGPGDELWDDSALLTAFDGAISKYKDYHCKKGQQKSADSGEVSADDGDTAPEEGHEVVREVVEIGKGGSETTGELKDRVQIAPPMEDYFAYQLGDEQNITASSDLNAPTAGDQSNLQPTEDYNELLSQYYELEEKRQRVLQQLHQLGGYYYENPAEASGSAAQLANCSTSQDHSDPAANQTSASAACICSLGGSDIVKTAMEAAERAISSVKGKTSDNNGVKDEKEQGMAQGPSSGTDLCDVLNAWYSAGFFTAKYLTEQSMAKK